MLSICVPAPIGRIKHVENLLNSLKHQSSKEFEVIVACDGDGFDEMHTLCQRYSFNIKCIHSPRDMEDVGNRNKARNVALSESVGEFLWPLDCDFILPPHAVEHIIHSMRQWVGLSKEMIITPCMGGTRRFPGVFEDPFSNIEDERAKIHCGFRDMFVDSEHPILGELAKLDEGMPIFSRNIYDATGGFDPELYGWGGNKQEFTHRIEYFKKKGDLDIFLLKSVKIIHLWHPSVASKERVSIPKYLRNRREINLGEAWVEKQRKSINKPKKLELGRIVHVIDGPEPSSVEEGDTVMMWSSDGRDGIFIGDKGQKKKIRELCRHLLAKETIFIKGDCTLALPGKIDELADEFVKLVGGGVAFSSKNIGPFLYKELGYKDAKSFVFYDCFTSLESACKSLEEYFSITDSKIAYAFDVARFRPMDLQKRFKQSVVYGPYDVRSSRYMILYKKG